MTTFLRLDSGEPLDAAGLRRLGEGETLALRVVGPTAPLRDGQIVHVRRGEPERPGGLGLAVAADASVVLAGTPDTTHVARVTAIERGAVRLDLDRRLVGRLPPRWLPRLADGLEILARFRRPLTPPLYVGTPETCVDDVRAKYGRTPEVRRYATLAAGELEPEERDAITAAVPRGGRLLDVGCGAGREAMGLARLGYRVVGVDLAPAMVAAAREAAAAAGLAIEFRVQSLTDLDEPPATYDGVYIAAALHHVPGRARRIEALVRVRRALVPGGALILFVVYRWPRSWLSRSRLVDGIRRVAARLPLGLPVSEPGDGYMREVSEVSDPRAPIFFHDYAGPEEVRAELHAAGFVAHEASCGWWVARSADGGESSVVGGAGALLGSSHVARCATLRGGHRGERGKSRD